MGARADGGRTYPGVTLLARCSQRRVVCYRHEDARRDGQEKDAVCGVVLLLQSKHRAETVLSVSECADRCTGSFHQTLVFDLTICLNSTRISIQAARARTHLVFTHQFIQRDEVVPVVVVSWLVVAPGHEEVHLVGAALRLTVENMGRGNSVCYTCRHVNRCSGTPQTYHLVGSFSRGMVEHLQTTPLILERGLSSNRCIRTSRDKY